jgi:uncharacterized protein
MNDLLDNQNGNNEETATPQNSVEAPPQYKTPLMHSLNVLFICAGFFLLGNVICGVIVLGLAKMQGVDFTELLSRANENSPIGDRNLIRVTLFLNHLFSFILPATATVILVYKKLAINYLKLDRIPNLMSIARSFLFLVVSIPLVQYVYLLNKMLPLPQWMRGAEQDTERMLSAIITKEHWYEGVINLLLIGVIPAIGEELVFRGILQQQIARLLKNEHLTVWLSAAIFSAIHMQFEGFFSRMILGAVLGYAFMWTRNLWVPMVIHLLNNSLQIIMIYALNVKPSETDKIISEDQITGGMALISLVLTLVVANLIRKGRENAAT